MTFPTCGFAVTYNPVLEFDISCNQNFGKQYYSDSEIDNVKLDNRTRYVSTEKGNAKRLSLDNQKFNYQSGIAYKNDDNKLVLNLLFTPENPGAFSTQTLAILVSEPLTIHMILTEPLMGNGRSFVRTSFYNCQFIN